MNRKIKALGLALVAALAMMAVMGSTASAQFTSSAAHTAFSGTQTESHIWTVGGIMACETAVFNGTQLGTSAATVVIKPTYGPTCTDSLSRVVHITKNTLEYHYLSGASKGNVQLTGEIVFTVTTSFGHCTVKWQGPQTLNGYTYTQSGNDLQITTHTTNITSSVSGGGFACGTLATHSAIGTYVGTTIMKGNGGGAKISVD